MANPNKQRGTAWESSVRNFLNRRLGLADDVGALLDPFDAMNIRRAAQEGAKDVGDVHAVPFILECKDVRSPAVPTWLRQADAEAGHARFPYGVVVHKRRGSAAGSGRVHFGVPTWTRVRLDLGMTARDFADRYGFTATVRGLDSSRWYMTTGLDEFAELLSDVRGVARAVR